MVMPISDKEYIADLGECMTKLEADLAALREENARLREAVGLATTCAPQMEMDSTHPVKMMQEVCRVFAILTRERDEARANCVRMSMRAGELGIEVARLEGLLLSVARVIRGRDGLPCWCDDYDARPDHTHSAKCIEARRVAELERDYAEVQDISVQEKLRADAAEARLARCVEALGEIRGRSLAAKTHEVGPLEAKGRLTRILELACAALAAAKGGE